MLGIFQVGGLFKVSGVPHISNGNQKALSKL
jgi:hypothetical protein